VNFSPTAFENYIKSQLSRCKTCLLHNTSRPSSKTLPKRQPFRESSTFKSHQRLHSKQPKMQLGLLVVFGLLTLGSAHPNVLSARVSCPQPMAVCNDSCNACDINGCEGINDPNGNLGVCTAGTYEGCYCSSICGASVNSCAKNGCEGENFICQAGAYRGCRCS